MHSLYKQSNLPYLNVKCCPNCESLLPLDTIRCPKCNYNFSLMNLDDPNLLKSKNEENKNETPAEVFNIKKEVPVEAKQEEPAPSQLSLDLDVPKEEKVEEKPQEVKPEKVIYCDKCGTQIIKGQKFCGSCGAKVSKILCSSCGEIIESNLLYCPLCGAKQNIVVEQHEEKEVPVQPQVQPQQQYYQPQPVIINVTNQTQQPQVQEEQPVAMDKEVEGPQTMASLSVEEPAEEPTPTEVVNAEVGDTLAEEYVNMGRKRLFIIIQLIITILIGAVMVMMPILTKDFLFTNIISYFDGSSTDTIFSGKDYFLSIITLFNNDLVIDPKNVALVSSSGEFYIFTSMPTIKTIIGMISSDVSSTQAIISYFAIGSVYLVITVSTLIIVISSIVGMISRKPFKGNALGLLVWMLVYGCVIVYINKFFMSSQGFAEFANADSWLIYAFALAFILWFIIKLVFFRETKIYNKKKEIETNQRIMHEH